VDFSEWIAIKWKSKQKENIITKGLPFDDVFIVLYVLKVLGRANT